MILNKRLLFFFLLFQAFLFSFEIHHVAAVEAQIDRKFVFVEELGRKIVVFPTVFAPNPYNRPMRQYLNNQDFSWVKNALEIGTRSGGLSFILLKKGARHVVATAINPKALENAVDNSKRFKINKNLEVRLVSIDRPEAG